MKIRIPAKLRSELAFNLGIKVSDLEFVSEKENNGLFQPVVNASFVLLLLVGLHFTTRFNYLLFHTLAEIFSIVIGFSIFVIAWNSRKYIRNSSLSIIGIGYLFIALLDLVHTLSYKGMPIFTGYDDYATELWIATRYLESATLLLAFIYLGRDKVPKTTNVLLLYTALTGFLLLAIFYWKVFPVCFIADVGLTPFKKISEYIICTILLASIFFLRKNREKFERRVFTFLLWSIICAILSELAFTTYISRYAPTNMVGHYLKILSFFLIYIAIIKTGIEQPFQLIFLDLEKANSSLNRKTAELVAKNVQLENEKRLLDTVVEALPTGLAITDQSGDVLQTNAAYEKIWGGSQPKILSVEGVSEHKASWIETGQPVAPGDWASSIAIRQGREALGQMLRVQRIDGTETMIFNSASPIHDIAGNIVGSAVSVQDITEWKRAEKALYESEQLLRLFIEHAPVALAMFDRDLRYLSASRRWLTDYGLEDRDLTGLSHYDVFNIPEEWRKAHRHGLAGQVSKAEDSRCVLPDGSVQWLRWEIHPWFTYAGTIGGIVIFTEDVTVRKEAEEQRRILNDELEKRVEQRTQQLETAQSQYRHAEKLSAIGKLTASIAHEFNSPLQGVITTLKGLKKRAILDDEDRELLDLAIAENERMKNLIRSLQDFNRPSTGRKELLDVHLLIDSLLLLYRSDLKKKMIRAELHYAETLPRTSAIPDQIKQVFLNLLNNAVDAIADKGGVIKIGTRPAGSKIAVAFTDSGMGIPPENLNQIFQPFYSTKSEGLGTGLGLSVCQGIVKNHGGEIKVDSRLGEGSTFTVYLPAQQVEIS